MVSWFTHNVLPTPSCLETSYGVGQAWNRGTPADFEDK